MEITVSSRHTELSEGLRSIAVEKISRLGRFLEGMDHAEVHFTEHRSSRNPNRQVCEVTMSGHGHHVRCKVAAPDAFAAVDIAVEKLEHQLHKLKTKLLRRSHTGPKVGELLTPAQELDAAALLAAENEGGPRIVKSKAHEMKPMGAEEAVLQMELLGHDFFLFTHVETGRAAVIYRREDGDIGLIDVA